MKSTHAWICASAWWSDDQEDQSTQGQEDERTQGRPEVNDREGESTQVNVK